MVSAIPRQVGRPLSAHLFGLMWFVNLCSPYLNVALGRPDIPSLIYSVLMGGVLFGLLIYKGPIEFRLPRLAWVGGLYLAYATLLAIIWGTRQESLGFLVQGGSAILALMVYRHPRECRVILLWITFGMAGYGVFLVWQSITGYKPPWLTTTNFLHDVGGYIRAGEGFGEKNYSAALLVLGLVIAWSMASYQQLPRWLARTVLAGCAFGMLFTFSRGAFVALGMVLVCYALSSSRRFGKLMLSGILLMPIVFYFFGGVLELIFDRFLVTSHQDFIQAASRWDQMAGALDIVMDASVIELLFGHGPFVYVNEIIIHNIPLALLVEQGVVGLMLWMWMIAMIARSCLISFRRGIPYPLMALVGFLVAGMLIRIELERMFWLMLIFLYALPRFGGYPCPSRAPRYFLSES